jgi:dCTP deaminase
VGDPSQWLVITPILNEREQLKAQNASVDLRLASVFFVPNRSQLYKLDPGDDLYEEHRRRYIDRVYVEIGEWFVLHPRQFALAQTIEWVHLPSDLAGYVVGRSSWGRDGLIIATATGVHPGWTGPLTLELTNVGEVPLLLWPGERYVQLFLHLVQPGDVGASPALLGGTFTGTTEPTSATPKVDELKHVIKRWKTPL